MVQVVLSEIGEVMPVSRGDKGKGLRFVRQFLVEFGYLERMDIFSDVLDDKCAEALELYQEFFGLVERHGNFTEETRRLMSGPRCSRGEFRPLLFPKDEDCVVRVRRWPRGKEEILYALDTHPGGTSQREKILEALNEAFALWKDQLGRSLPLSFNLAKQEEADLLIDWIAKDEVPRARLGAGRVAFCDFPPEQNIGGRRSRPLMLFDMGQRWSTESTPGIFHITSVAMHEIGHLIGLDHCGHSKSVMNPNIKAGGGNIVLQEEDKKAVRLLYETSMFSPGLVQSSSRKPKTAVRKMSWISRLWHQRER